MVRTDESIRGEVIRKLAWDPCVDASKVSVEVRDGSVTLRGEVATEFERSAAHYDAWEIAGVSRVSDRLRVAYRPSAAVAANAEIESDIRRKLAELFQ